MLINPFLKKLRPFMDADSGVSGGAAAPQGTEGTTTTGGDSTGGATGAEGTTGTTGTEGASTATDPASQKAVQTPEQNAAFAEMRRKAEAAEKRAAEAEQVRQRDINIAKKYGKDYGIFTEADIAEKFGQSHNIKTLADFEAALQAEEARKAGIDPDLINRLINEHPDIKKARELTARQEAEMGQRALKTELAELEKEYPDLKIETIQDIQKLPNFEAILNKAQNGYSLLDAYESVNKAEIRKQQAEAARQATLNSVQGKEHLKGNGKGSEIDTTTIPDDVLEMYKALNPGKTFDEYKAHYKKSLGK